MCLKFNLVLLLLSVVVAKTVNHFKDADRLDQPHVDTPAPPPPPPEPEPTPTPCTCSNQLGSNCGSRSGQPGNLHGHCNPNELFYCFAPNTIPVSKGVCGICYQNAPGLDLCMGAFSDNRNKARRVNVMHPNENSILEEPTKCTCGKQLSSNCGSRKDQQGNLVGPCNPNELYYCLAPDSIPISQGLCEICHQQHPGLDFCNKGSS